MKPSFPCAVVLPVSFLTFASTLLAHPGHDDGHELTWELGHLAAHPLATLGCVTLLGVVGWVGLRVYRGRVQSLRGSQASRGK